MSTWTGQDWAYLLGGAAVLIPVLLTSVAGFITSIVTLRRLGEVNKTVVEVAKQVDGLLVARDASNVAAGELIGRKAGDDASEQRAEGRREQREIRSGQDAVAALNVRAGNAPVPVADDRAAMAGERGAAATERIADAAEATSPLSKKL